MIDARRVIGSVAPASVTPGTGCFGMIGNLKWMTDDADNLREDWVGYHKNAGLLTKASP